MHIHLTELPGWMSRKGSDTAVYAGEVMSALSALNFTHTKVMTSANYAQFLIQQIAASTGIQPEPEDVILAIQDFTYHYENYCLRAYIFREKVLLFLNAGLQIGFKPNEVNLKMIAINPTLKSAGLNGLLDKFDSRKPGPLGKLINQRKVLTHRLSYGLKDPLLRPVDEEFDGDMRTWCRKWSKNISNQARQVDTAEYQIPDIHHTLAEKVIKYRDGLRASIKKNQTR